MVARIGPRRGPTGRVEATVAVTPANVPVLRSALARRDPGRHTAVQIATYPFPSVDGLPPGVENHSTVGPADAWRIDATGGDERLMRPGHEGLIRDCSPNAVVSDILFYWNADIAASVGVPCVTFHAIGAFPMQALATLIYADTTKASGGVVGVVTLPEFLGPDVRIPVTELPAEARSQQPDVVRAAGAK
jgi:hypothetical protein